MLVSASYMYDNNDYDIKTLSCQHLYIMYAFWVCNKQKNMLWCLLSVSFEGDQI